MLPNAPIPDDAKLESFVVPGERNHNSTHVPPSADNQNTAVEAVERAAGLTLFSEAIKASSKHICKTARCEVIVRRFDDAQKRPEVRRSLSAPR